MDAYRLFRREGEAGQARQQSGSALCKAELEQTVERLSMGMT